MGKHINWWNIKTQQKNILLKDEDALVKELFNKDWYVKPWKCVNIDIKFWATICDDC